MMSLNDLETEIGKHFFQTKDLPGYVIVSPEDFLNLTGKTRIVDNPVVIDTKYGEIYLESKIGVQRAIIIWIK